MQQKEIMNWWKKERKKEWSNNVIIPENQKEISNQVMPEKVWKTQEMYDGNRKEFGNC